MLLLATACGQPEARPAIVVEVVPFASDGEVPREGWRLKGEDAKELPLATTGEVGAHRGLLFRAVAPQGRYALMGPAPWSLVGGPVLVAMQPGTPPTALGVGVAHTLYVLPPEGRTVGQVVLRAAGTGTDASSPVPTTRVDGSDGRVALRIPPDRWAPAVLVAAALGTDTFARAERVNLPKDGTCTGVALGAGPTLPVRVTTFPAGEAKGALALVAHGEEFAVRREADLDAAGGVSFDAFPETSRRVELSLVGAPGARPTATWRLSGADVGRGDLRLAVVGPSAAGASRVKVTGGPVAEGAVTVQVRRPGWPSYGVLPDVRVEADGATLAVPNLSGDWRLLVATADRVGLLASGGDPDAPVVLERPCRVQASVEGGVPRGRRYELECVRVEPDGEATAQGWYDRLVGRADLELSLPAGRYRLRLREGARAGLWNDLTLETPSTRASIRLTAPR
ncbi:MAG: hypothetical protein U1E39_01055 [Planctomycetota bacterium]